MRFWKGKKTSPIVKQPSQKEFVSSAIFDKSQVVENSQIYQGLTLSTSGHIRLLDLQPRSRESHVECTLKAIELSPRPLYTAISYTWGQETEQTLITVNGLPFRVRRNLYDLLKDLRHQNQSRTLWIDAICINQEDISERNAQLRIMGDIFKSATNVISWLENDIGDQNLTAADGAAILEACSLGKELQSSQTARFWEKLDLFFNHPYWSRRWIIQEIALARSVTLVCGPYKFPLAALPELDRRQFHTPLAPGSRHYHDLTKNYSFPFSNYKDTKARQLYRLQQKQAEATTSTKLINLLVQYQDSQCQDRKDKIYAFLSLCEHARKHILVDYASDLPTLLVSVLEFAVASEGLQPHRSLLIGHSLMDQLGVTSADLTSEFSKLEDPAQLIANRNFYFRTHLSILGSVKSLLIPAKFYHVLEQHKSKLRAIRHYHTIRLQEIGRNDVGQIELLAKSGTILDATTSPQDLCSFVWGPESNTDQFLIGAPNLHLGLATCHVTADDRICQFPFHETAIVLRPEKSEHYAVIGRAALLDIRQDGSAQNYSAPMYRYFGISEDHWNQSFSTKSNNLPESKYNSWCSVTSRGASTASLLQLADDKS